MEVYTIIKAVGWCMCVGGRGRGVDGKHQYYRQLASVCALAMDTTQVCTVTSTHRSCVTPAVRGKV